MSLPLSGYTLIRSRRRSVGLQVQQDATLIIRAPYFVSKRMIENVIREKWAWIEKTKEKMRAHSETTVEEDSSAGRRILYLGQTHHLEIRDQLCIPLQLEGNRFILSREYLSHTKTMLARWYRERALEFLPDRVRHFAQKADVSYRSIKINSARTRWGSCSERGTLNFSWRIMMVPPDVMEYVVVHEVAHRVHPNHSRAFWTFVGKLCPGYQASREWLRKHGDFLGI